MKTCWINIAFVFPLVCGIAAEAAELQVLSSYGARAVMTELAPKFQHATGHTLAIKFTQPRMIAKHIQNGEIADVVITGGVDFAKGQILPASVAPVMRSLMGMAVRKDAARPDISSPDAVRHALLAAKSISRDDGPAAAHFAGLLDQWGIGDTIREKTIIGGPPPRRVGDLVANGEVEIGVHVISLLIGIRGIEIVGPLPDDMQHANVTSAAIMAGAKDTEAARALIAFLRTPEAAAVIRAKGMEPVIP